MASAFAPWVWVGTLLLLAVVVGFDLVVIGRRTRAVTLSDASRWVGLYVALAVMFGLALVVLGPDGSGAQFFAGYVTEYSLSVDNLFVFLLLMARFAVPPVAQDKVLYLGIVLSMALRAVFILAGAAAISAATWTFVVFGGFLLYTSLRLLVSGEDQAEVEEGLVVRALRRVVPMTPENEGRRLAVRREGRWLITPLFLAVSAIAVANVVFAFDSIPAIFGLTKDPLLVLSANAFALLGLRQLYFLIGGLMQRLAYLAYGLAAILGFIGAKLVLEGLRPHVDRVGPVDLPEIGTGTSLVVILVLLLAIALANLARVAVRPRTSRDGADACSDLPRDTA